MKKMVNGVLITLSAAATALSADAATIHYTGSGVGVTSPTNVELWGSSNITNNSVAFELIFDYTPTVSGSLKPFLLFEVGGATIGSALVLDGANLRYFSGAKGSAGAGATADDIDVLGAHGLTATNNDVQIVAVTELGAGLSGANTLSIYVNGDLIATDNTISSGGDWAGVSASAIGTAGDATNNASEGVYAFGSGAFNVFTDGDDDDITLNVYDLNHEDNTVAGILVPEPSSLALLGLGGLCMMKRRRHESTNE